MNLASIAYILNATKLSVKLINSNILLCLIALFYLFAITGLRKTLLLSFWFSGF